MKGKSSAVESDKEKKGRSGTAEPRSVVLGTAGHIDHGKTALVLALTGTDTDRLPEEKARGITIDLGFAALELRSPAGKVLDVSLIDVPGHHAFIRNMLAGAGGIDAVMLVVAADEGVKAQTLEHLQICRLLGIQRGLVVLTKKDAVLPERLAAARAEVEALLEGSFLQGAPIVPVSALHRQGLVELKMDLARLLATVSDRSADQVARLPVDRVFSVRGFGTVVTGTLQAGVVAAGQSLSLQPGERPVRVRGLQVHGKARREAKAPNRVALNVAGVEVAEVHRGDTVTPDGLLEPTSVVDVEIDAVPGAPPLRHRGRVRLHAFAAETLATVLLYAAPEQGSDNRPPLARLRLSKPMLLVPGDRFVLRQPSPAVTIGGGRVLDAHPLPKLRKTAAAEFLRRLQAASPLQAVQLWVERRGLRGISLASLVAETGTIAESLQRLLAKPLAEGRLVGAAGHGAFLDHSAFTEAQERIFRVVENARRDGAMTRTALRSGARLDEWVFMRALEQIVAAGRLRLQGDTVALPETARVPAESSGDRRLATLENLYRAAGLASPLVSEVTEQLRLNATEVRGLLTSLLRSGKLVRLGSDALLVHREALERLRSELQKQRGQSLDVGRFKTLTGLTRKHAIPLLEYLDGTRVTRNVGGVRTVV